MKESTTSGGRSIKVGVITDQTGALSFCGIANANVAKMVINDINASGGSQSYEARPAGSSRCDLRWHLQLHEAGYQGSCLASRSEVDTWSARTSTRTS